MKKYFIIGAAAALLTTSCSTDVVDNTEVDNTGKERIVLGAGDNQTALISRAGFSSDTRIIARIVSDKRGGGATQCVTTVLTAKEEKSSQGYSNVEYLDGNTRYWDDAYGRNSILSVYAVAIPNKKNDEDGTNMPSDLLKGATTWGTSNADDNTLTWSVTANQTEELLENEDLAYSNNIQQTGKKGVYTWNYSTSKYPEGATNASQHGTDPTDGRLYFTQSSDYTAALNDGPGHFDKGQMEFKHALSRIQVNLKQGEGYSAAPFTVTSMQVLNQHVKGTFDIQAATWNATDAATAVNMAALTHKTSMAATYEAQMLPGYIFAANDNNVLKLIVDGNTYFITNNMLRTALTDVAGVSDDFSTEVGKRYIFTLDVTKNKISNITATIVDWNNVNATETSVNNSHVTFSFYNATGTVCHDLKLWKFEETLTSGIATDNSYSAPATAEKEYSPVGGFSRVGDTDKYETSEYYKNNETAYHFRSTNAATALNTGNKTFTMQSGSAAANDYHWGAPMTSGISAIPYNDVAGETQGYLSSIAKGIVAASTDSEIKLTEIHMMSQLVVKLKTSDDGSAVNLAGATVTLTKFSDNGTVDMGSGFIVPSNTINTTGMTLGATSESNTYSIYVVPQELKRNSGASDADYVGITIHTTDNNEYYIVKKLSEITATTVGSQVTNLQTEGGKILQWYPGHKYIYTFNITKTEIKNITATIVGWNEVVAGNTNLDLEK